MGKSNPKSRYCVWSVDENGAYDTECGHKFEFMDGDRHENHFEYCPYCGKKIIDGKSRKANRSV